MFYLLDASTPKSKSIFLWPFPSTSSSTMPAVKNYTYTLLFSKDIQGRMEASEINLKKEKDGSNLQRN